MKKINEEAMAKILENAELAYEYMDCSLADTKLYSKFDTHTLCEVKDKKLYDLVIKMEKAMTDIEEVIEEINRYY